MTLKDGAQKAFTSTEAEMKPHWNTVISSYRTALKNIDAELSKVYAKYLSTVDPADYYNIMIQYDRLTKLQKAISVEYSAAAKEAAKYTAISSEIGMTNTYYKNQYTLTFF